MFDIRYCQSQEDEVFFISEGHLNFFLQGSKDYLFYSEKQTRQCVVKGEKQKE